MRRFVSVVDNISSKFGRFVSYWVLIIAAVMMYEVILRFAFHSPTIWAYETSILFFGSYAVLGGAYCLMRGKHVRVDIWWGSQSPKRKAIADLCTSVFAFTLLGSLIWFAIPWAWESFLVREVDATVFAPPLYPSKIMLVVATFFMFIQLIAEIIRNIYAVSGKPAEVPAGFTEKEA